jgi:hypothetical protein
MASIATIERRKRIASRIKGKNYLRLAEPIDTEQNAVDTEENATEKRSKQVPTILTVFKALTQFVNVSAKAKDYQQSQIRNMRDMIRQTSYNVKNPQLLSLLRRMSEDIMTYAEAQGELYDSYRRLGMYMHKKIKMIKSR